jgi:phosphoribosylamine--glycine ligase
MKIALIGSGGRENALAYKLAESKSLTKLYILPGNPGTLKYGENINITEKSKIIEFCVENRIDLVVIGPEKPLVEGLADDLRKNGISVFGPSSKAAEIEGNKSFSKELMNKYGIPTAKYKTFTREQSDEARKYIREHELPIVIKASGLAAGKGVAICNSYNEAESYLDDLFIKNIFGDAGQSVVIEEFMDGEEASIFAITDGNNFIVLPSAQDHKRVFDNDEGKNTGGMGAYAPAPIVTDSILKKVENEIIVPTLKAMVAENRPFIGCLYCGLMIKDDNVKVVEFNCRFGDPETQAVVTLLEGDVAKLLYSCANGKIDKTAVKYNGGSSICVVLASGGYPDSFQKGYEIYGIDDIKDDNSLIFHSGTKLIDGKLITDGGRVLNIIVFSKKNDLMYCKERCYNEISKVKYTNMHYRKDIGDKGISHLKLM